MRRRVFHQYRNNPDVQLSRQDMFEIMYGFLDIEDHILSLAKVKKTGYNDSDKAIIDLEARILGFILENRQVSVDSFNQSLLLMLSSHMARAFESHDLSYPDAFKSILHM